MRGWEGSDLRAWLNETFLRQAFTPEEQGRLIKLKIESYGLYDEDWEMVKTEDTVFLLSEEEMTDLDSRVVKACSQPVDKAMGWWLRDWSIILMAPG